MILAVIPGYNEGPRIAEVVRGTAVHLPVVVIDDGSSDDTAAQARAAGATVIEQRPNQGKGAALRVGFRRALADSAEAVLTLDADGQHDPAEITAFLAAWEAEPRPDLVIGRRNFRAMPPIRRLSNVLGGRAFSWAVGRPIPDNQSGYRLVSRRIMEATLASGEHGFEFEVEMITSCIRIGGTIAWVPIRTIYAGEPSHIRPIAHLRSFIRIVRKARRDVGVPLG
ncbi:MAG TPA: glycosyltransferase family 2 protein [Candidatus Limnocylindrales bacterium]|nr:glycosyltransferase family 2 protein [Candidatus Limnocylindrales bacterium]